MERFSTSARVKPTEVDEVPTSDCVFQFMRQRRDGYATSGAAVTFFNDVIRLKQRAMRCSDPTN